MFIFFECNTNKARRGSSCSFYHRWRDVASYSRFSFNFWAYFLDTILYPFDVCLLVVECTAHHLSLPIDNHFIHSRGRTCSPHKFDNYFEVDIIVGSIRASMNEECLRYAVSLITWYPCRVCIKDAGAIHVYDEFLHWYVCFMPFCCYVFSHHFCIAYIFKLIYLLTKRNVDYSKLQLQYK